MKLQHSDSPTWSVMSWTHFAHRDGSIFWDCLVFGFSSIFIIQIPLDNHNSNSCLVSIWISNSNCTWDSHPISVGTTTTNLKFCLLQSDLSCWILIVVDYFGHWHFFMRPFSSKWVPIALLLALSAHHPYWIKLQYLQSSSQSSFVFVFGYSWEGQPLQTLFLYLALMNSALMQKFQNFLLNGSEKLSIKVAEMDFKAGMEEYGMCYVGRFIWAMC